MNKFLLLLSVLLLSACRSPTPNYDAKFGDAVRQAKQDMVINPNAGKVPATVAGIDGKAAHASQGRYEKSFKAPPPTVNVLSVGGTVSGEKYDK